jgi:predicted DNA-binding transcriptional regulator AlpA
MLRISLASNPFRNSNNAHTKGVMVMVNTNVDALLNQKQVAQILGMSEAWMEQCRFKKTGVPFIKIGRAVRYRLGDVQAFINIRIQNGGI